MRVLYILYITYIIYIIYINTYIHILVHIHDIYTHTHTPTNAGEVAFAPKLTATASVAQSVERWSRDPESRVRFPAGGLGVAFFATGPGWVLKCISFWHSNLLYFKKPIDIDNECKC